MTYDDYLKEISKSKQGDLKYMALVSILPFFPLSIKLMTRKNNGKKPFSNEFNFKYKIDQIKECDSLIKKNLDEEKIEPTLDINLKSFNEILFSAKNEMKNIGLKNDLTYMINEVETVINILKK